MKGGRGLRPARGWPWRSAGRDAWGEGGGGRPAGPEGARGRGGGGRPAGGWGRRGGRGRAASRPGGGGRGAGTSFGGAIVEEGNGHVKVWFGGLAYGSLSGACRLDQAPDRVDPIRRAVLPPQR